jgi:LmbE family N-acetylglucosaminyl deacetylase
VLSCAGLLRAVGPERARVVNVCTGDPPAAARRRHDIAEPELRRDEDRRALATLGVEPIDLGLLDAIYRTAGGAPIYPRLADVFRDDVPAADAAQEQRITTALAALLGRLAGPVLVVAPLGIGSHVDHVLTGRACLAVADLLCFYEDFPYVVRSSFGRFLPPQAALARHGLEATGCYAVPVDVDDKLAAIGCYASQITMLFDDLSGCRQSVQALTHAGQPAEFLWRARPATPAAGPERGAA